MFVSGWKFVDGISRVEIDGEDAYFSTRKTSQLPRVPLELPTKCVSFLSVGIHRPPLLFLPLFVYSTFERSRPSFHSRWTHTHTHTRAGRKMGMAMEVNFGKVRPCISTKDFVLVYLEYVCIFVRIRIKVTEWLQKLRVYNTSPLEKIEFKSEKKKKKPEFRNDRISPPFFPSSTLLHRDIFTERILRKCIVATIIGNSTTQRN